MICNDQIFGLCWSQFPYFDCNGKIKFRFIWKVLFIICVSHFKIKFHRFSAQSPAGTGWRLVPGDLKYISCGAFGCWGVDKQGTIYFRKGVSTANPAGTEWMTIPGSLRMVESGPEGKI